MELNELYGRLLLDTEVPADLKKELIKNSRPALIQHENYIECQRCLSKTLKNKARLPNGAYYCPKCILLGRVASNNKLYHLPEKNLFSSLECSPLVWQGQLSLFQQQCSDQLRKAVDRSGEYLMWAVTGAGKTEMLFPTLEKVLLQRKRVCLASPRVDVCNELYPRICTAFTAIDPVLLHGHSKKSYHYSQLTICTTHQLLRFLGAFDLLIIDEVDAFPFTNNEMLKQAARRALKPNGTLIFLTATPTQELLGKIERHQLAASYLPLRFHRHLLPVPQVWFCGRWQDKMYCQKLPVKLKSELNRWIDEGFPFLVFVSRLELLAPVLRALEANLPAKAKGDSVFSADPKRINKVQEMRDHKLNYLVTTTILERGVTFPSLNVMVLGADEKTFSTTALVQIAGRAGRSQKRPNGDVIFVCTDQVTNVRKAVKQIRELNKKGKRLLNG